VRSRDDLRVASDRDRPGLQGMEGDVSVLAFFLADFASVSAIVTQERIDRS
jgi:hypothetical protein